MMKVAFQGVKGAYSELAAGQYFAKRVETVACPEFADVFRSVSKAKSDFGIVPMENSLTGSIHQNFDLLLQNKLWICGEIKLRVSHSLLAAPKTTIKKIKKVFSHPQALWQCHKFFISHPWIEAVPYFDTAGSARFISEEGKSGYGAIASRAAAGVYGLKVIREGIEDSKENYTRFFILSTSKRREVDGANKSTIVFGLRDLPGALHRALQAFAEWKVQIHKIESRPIPGRPWEYLFYVDFAANGFSGEGEAILKDLRKVASRLRLLGSYIGG